MTVPANLSAAFFGRVVGHAVVSIATPLNGSVIGSNAISEAISGTASSSAGNITSVQYQIDGGAWQAISITPGATVNYTGGNAGGIGAGDHTVMVKASDAAGNTATVSSSYAIANSNPNPGYAWNPPYTYNDQHHYLTIVNAIRNAPVSYSLVEYDAHGNVIGQTSSNIVIGMTDSNGNFNYTGTAEWAAGGWSCVAGLYVNGNDVANYTFYNRSQQPSISYGPSITQNGAITLSIAGNYANSTVAQTVTYAPSGRNVGPIALGSTDAMGNFSTAYALTWGSDTSATISLTLDGQGLGTFSFAP
jgi:hypothetical protein